MLPAPEVAPSCTPESPEVCCVVMVGVAVADQFCVFSSCSDFWLMFLLPIALQRNSGWNLTVSPGCLLPCHLSSWLAACSLCFNSQAQEYLLPFSGLKKAISSKSIGVALNVQESERLPELFDMSESVYARQGFYFDMNQGKENCFKGTSGLHIGIKFNE